MSNLSKWTLNNKTFRGKNVNMPPRTHLSRKEASEYTGFSVQTLAKWAVTHKGPPFTKFGTGQSARVRYAIADLDAFLRGDTKQGGQAA